MSNGRLEVIARILDIVAGSAEIDRISRYMHSDVVVNMDGLAFRGLSAWKKWIRYSRARSGLEGTVLEIVDAGASGERLRVAIVGRGRRGGRRVTSEPAWITYRFAGGKVAETWTSRHNYAFFFGARVRHPIRFAWLVCNMVTWCWLRDLGSRSP